MKSLIDRIPVCPHSSKSDIDLELCVVLGKIEAEIGEELDYTSGYRCPECNLKAGGVKNSAHLRGLAVDIRCHDSLLRCKIENAAVKIGITRRGIGKNIIHLDIDSSLPQGVLWLY